MIFSGNRIGGLSPLARKGAVAATSALAVLIVFAALPFLWLARLEGDVAAQKAELALVTARAERTRNRGLALTAADQPERMFLPAETAGTTLAAFQSLVKDAASRNGMGVLRMQPLPMDEVSGAAPYQLGVDASGSLEQLRNFLADVESMLPLVIVTGLEVRPRVPAGAETQPYSSEDLAVSMKLEAFAWRGVP